MKEDTLTLKTGLIHKVNINSLTKQDKQEDESIIWTYILQF